MKIHQPVLTEFIVTESINSSSDWVISLFVHRNKNNVASLDGFPLFSTF